MDIEEFRRHAHIMVDWMADYLNSVEDHPVRAQVKPGEIAAKLDPGPPQDGEPMQIIFDDFKRDIMPGMTHWQHPNFFAYFTANSSPPSILAEMLTSTLGAQCMLWQTSPAASEMEGVVMDWLRQMIALPKEFKGVIQDSATSATLVALLTAREQKTGWRANAEGLSRLGQSGIIPTAYCSKEAHSSIEKGLKVAGYGKNSLRKITTKKDYAMDPADLERQIIQDLTDGLTPTVVVASIGGTSVGAIDNLEEIGLVCRKFGLWLHVDAAWAGSALILPELQYLIKGADNVDSFVFNPHKWLLTNFDCSAYFIRDVEALEKTLALVPEYLKSPEGRDVTDYQNWSVPLGRRFRALKLWFVIRSYGVAGLQKILREHLRLAQLCYDSLHNHPDFEITSPLHLTLFTFRYRPSGRSQEDDLEALNLKLINTINNRGKIYLTQTRIDDIFTIRFTVGQTYTAEQHIRGAIDEILTVARDLS